MSGRLPRKLAVPAAAAAMFGVLAACGSSEGSQDSASSGGALDLDASEAVVADYQSAPSEIPVSEPLAKAPEEGTSFVWMTCQLSDCQVMGKAMEDAVTSLGWEYREISYDQANPATLVNAMREALRYDPAYVGMSGIAPETWASIVPEYKEAGAKIVASYLGETSLDEEVVMTVSGPRLNETQGEALAQWFIADSEGKGKAVLQTVSDYPSNKIMSDTFVDTVDSGCPDCDVTVINSSLADVGAGRIVPSIVSELRSRPDHTYAFATYAPFVDGLPAALQAAGIGDQVKIGGGYASPVTKQAIEDGLVAAGTAESANIASFLMVDAAVRDATATPQPANGQVQDIQLLTTDVDFTIGVAHDVPADYADQFKKLWGVS